MCGRPVPGIATWYRTCAEKKMNIFLFISNCFCQLDVYIASSCLAHERIPPVNVSIRVTLAHVHILGKFGKKRSVKVDSHLRLSQMGRPRASAANKMLAVEFAKSVTRQTGDTDDLVARCGRYSLYCALKEMFPHIAREGSEGERDGLAEVEFNKLLQVFDLTHTRC